MKKMGIITDRDVNVGEVAEPQAILSTSNGEDKVPLIHYIVNNLGPLNR